MQLLHILQQELRCLSYIFITIVYLFFFLIEQDAESLNITQQVFSHMLYFQTTHTAI